MSESKQKAIIDKLRKLIRHEQSARSIGSLAEAATFAAKIQDLLDQYNLSLSDIDVEDLRSTVKGEYADLKVANYWQHVFLLELSAIYGCRTIFRSNVSAMIVGNEVDRLLLIEVFSYFEELGRHLSAAALKEWQLTAEYRRKRKKAFHSRQWRTSFHLGYILALIHRIKEQHAAAKAAATTETGLIYIGNKLADASAWVENNLAIRTNKLKRKKVRDDAFARGYETGKNVALTTSTLGG